MSGQSFGSDFVVFEVYFEIFNDNFLNFDLIRYFQPGSRHTFKEAFGRQIANPTAMILGCANMLNHLNLREHGHALRRAVEKVIEEGKVRTRDLGGYASTNDFVYATIEKFDL